MPRKGLSMRKVREVLRLHFDAGLNARKIALSNPAVIEEMLGEMYSPDWLRKTAFEVGMVKRERKIDPVALFWKHATALKDMPDVRRMI
jgi:hypothetical protein